ncbi:unknown protein [Seminavis robusta]|uniref:Uncharacterized protein n=1 Tax=Seminavis robusta TaxID=568900 RepID=A0A9N8F1F0_9STRA|nr:unknown protein [Seminavis robusta]|eukprot:Sro2337_g323880.1 n/a (1316) ;mRNA; f:6821-10768
MELRPRRKQRSKSCLDLRNLFDRSVSPTETASDSSDRSDSNDSNEIEDFSQEAFMLTVQQTIGCRPRKKKGTPLLDYILAGNSKLESGWLQKRLMANDNESINESIKVPGNEKRLLLFLFVALSGAGWGADGTSPSELLSTAWGVSKPAIRRACSSALDDSFLAWATQAYGSNPESSEVDESNNKRSVRPENPSEQAAANNVFSPAVMDRNSKRRDMRDTPSIFVAAEDFASPVSVLSPAQAQSVCSPVSVSSDGGDDDGFLSPTIRNEHYEQPRRHNGTRLDFNRAENVDATAQTDEFKVDATTQTDDDLLSDEESLPDEPVLDFHGRIMADINADNISFAVEEAISRVVAFLFKKKKDALALDFAQEDNEDDNEQDDDESDLAQILRASARASAEIITLRPFKNGSPLKILRIRENRKGTGDKKGRKLRAKGFLVEALLSNLELSFDETVSIIQSLGKRRGVRMIKQENDCGLDIAQCAALMLYLPATGRALERLQKFMKWAVPSIGPSLFPLTLRKKIAKYSMDMFDIKLGFELVSLEIGGHTRNQRCLHVWIKEPAVAIQRLTQSALVAGKFEDSILFSNHEEELIVVQGSDRGGDVTANLVRLANRLGGNSSQHCLPLSFYEFGKESYYNLQATIFHPHKPTRQFLQSLLNGEYHMIVVTVHNSSSGAVLDAQCKMLRFVFPEGCRWRLVVDRYNQDETEVVAATVEERSLPPSVRLFNPEEEALLQQDQDRIGLSLQLIVSSTADQDNDISYNGFKLRNCFGRAVHTEYFTEDLVCAAANNFVQVCCLQSKCLTADDIKCNTTVMGQGTASVMCPCTICIAPKKDFAAYLTKPRDEQPANREGELSNPRLFEGFIAEAKGLADWVRLNSAGRAKTLKMKYRSVVYSPLLYTPPAMNTCSGMHVSSGLLTHLTTRLLVQLGELDKSTKWLTDLRIMVAEANQFLPTSNQTAEKLRKQDAKLVRDISAARSMGATEMIEQLQRERDNIGTTLQAQTKARDAAKLFVEKGNEFLGNLAKKTKNRIVGEATYCFRKAYEVDGRVNFRVENSGFELSNGDGLRVLERRDKIVARMHKVYDDNPVLQRGVSNLMDTYLKQTSLLNEMSVAMKSQRKWSVLACDQFEAAAQEYAKLWISSGARGEEDATIFNKLHVLVTHIPQFVRLHGMLGRGSEEGFESSHKCIERVRDPLKCMTSTEERAHTIYRRIMLQSRPEIETIFEEVNEHFSQKKRGPYRKDPSRMKTADSAPAAGRHIDSLSLPEGFIQSINGYVVKEQWKDYFEYVCFSKVPSSWSAIFRNDDGLGSACQVRTEYV